MVCTTSPLGMHNCPVAVTPDWESRHLSGDPETLGLDIGNILTLATFPKIPA